jgi:hypothetical protein
MYLYMRDTQQYAFHDNEIKSVYLIAGYLFSVKEHISGYYRHFIIARHKKTQITAILNFYRRLSPLYETCDWTIFEY